MPNAPLYQEQPVRTLDDFLSTEAQGFIHDDMPPPVHGLEQVSQRLLNRLDNKSRMKQAKVQGLRHHFGPYLTDCSALRHPPSPCGMLCWAAIRIEC